MIKTIQVGTEIYYTGDMANVEGFGEVISYHKKSKYIQESVDIKLEDGRVFEMVSLSSFVESPGQRFYTKRKWQAKQQAKTNVLERRLVEMGIRH